MTPRSTPVRTDRAESTASTRSAMSWPVLWDRLTMVLVVASVAALVWPVQTTRSASGDASRDASRDEGRDEGRSATATQTADSTTATVVAAAAGSVAVDSLVTIAIQGNVFSATRTAPRTAFVMPGQTLAMSTTDAGVADSAMSLGSLMSDSLPRLSGIVSMAGERRALLQFSARDGAPRLYRVGEGTSEFRVRRIDANAVVLTSKSGIRTVRLSPPAPSDSTDAPL